MKRLSSSAETKLRFVLVGSFNTLFDFSLLSILTSFTTLSIMSANIVSTTIAFVGSFFLNRSYTFRTTSSNTRRQFVLFSIVTLSGLWGIQTIVIWLLSPLLINTGIDSGPSLIIAKTAATAASLIWNYSLYSRVVFQTPTNSSD